MRFEKENQIKSKNWENQNNKLSLLISWAVRNKLSGNEGEVREIWTGFANERSFPLFNE